MLLNVYASATTLPPLPPGTMVGNQRSWHDPELAGHLRGFMGFLLQAVGGRPSSRLMPTMQTIACTRHQLSIPEPGDLTAFMHDAYAIGFLPDGTVRDPHGRVLVGPKPDDEARARMADDAVERMAGAVAWANEQGVRVPDHLTPGLGTEQALMRTPRDVALRALALLAVAIRGETCSHDRPVPTVALRSILGPGLDALSVREKAFLEVSEPGVKAPKDQVEPVARAMSWRYEAAAGLLRVLGVLEATELPHAQVDVPTLIDAVRDLGAETMVARATLPSLEDRLVAQCRIRCLNWAIRDAVHTRKTKPPAGLAMGPVAERHHALNWLTGQWGTGWDELDTPS